MAVTSDARGGAGGEKFGIRVNSRAITAAAMEKVGDADRRGGGSGSGVDADPELLPSSAPAGVAGDGFCSGNCAGLFTDFGDASRARTASGVRVASCREEGTRQQRLPW